MIIICCLVFIIFVLTTIISLNVRYLVYSSKIGYIITYTDIMILLLSSLVDLIMFAALVYKIQSLI